MSDVDNATETVPNSTPAALPTGSDPQGSAPAPADTAATEGKAEGDEPDKQSRRESRAFATQRREIRELNRQLGHLQAQLEMRPTAEGDQNPQARITPEQAAYIQQQREIAATVVEQLEDAGEGIDGFDKVIKTITGNDFPMTTVMRDYLGESDRKAEMAQWFADSPEEARRISRLTEALAVKAMERAESKLGKAAPRTTRALAPVRTVGGSASATPDPAKMSMDDYATWRLKRS